MSRPMKAVGMAEMAAIWMVVKKLFQAVPDQTSPCSPWTMPKAAIIVAQREAVIAAPDLDEAARPGSWHT